MYWIRTVFFNCKFKHFSSSWSGIFGLGVASYGWHFQFLEQGSMHVTVLDMLFVHLNLSTPWGTWIPAHTHEISGDEVGRMEHTDEWHVILRDPIPRQLIVHPPGNVLWVLPAMGKSPLPLGFPQQCDWKCWSNSKAVSLPDSAHKWELGKRKD